VHNLGPLTRLEHRVKTHSPGGSDNPNPGFGSGDHPTTPTTWSATPEPNTSETDSSPARYGRQRPTGPPSLGDIGRGKRSLISNNRRCGVLPRRWLETTRTTGGGRPASGA
jgi:hypothetical protein